VMRVAHRRRVAHLASGVTWGLGRMPAGVVWMAGRPAWLSNHLNHLAHPDATALRLQSRRGFDSTPIP
jgi:hypothetical protein